jgi:hypothetical protein
MEVEILFWSRFPTRPKKIGTDSTTRIFLAGHAHPSLKERTGEAKKEIKIEL